jgi:hypothetical protein
LDNRGQAGIPWREARPRDLASVDPATGEVVALFHPRRDRWADHFRLEGGTIEPLTPTGRVTARLLHFNDAARAEERALLIRAGILTPATE